MACTNPVRLQKDFSISSLKATEPRGGGGGTELKVPVAQSPGFHIPVAKISRIPESQFPYTRRFLDF